MTYHALSLDHPEARDAAVVGAKAAGLAALRHAGFEVPDAVTLPVGLDELWPSGPPPQVVHDLVVDACERLGPRLAVRASATWEDNATSAHAGASTTVLDVSGPVAVLDAVRACLDGTAEAGRQLGEDGGTAVVLQRLVDPDHAGVAFTADPITGERGVVRIAATAGLGEALVQGEVVGSDVTVRGDEVEGDLAGLGADVARSVARVARAVEAAMGCPQDVEWASAGGTVHLLQARPITVLPVRPERPEGNNWQKDVAHYPEPMTPFGWSVLKTCEPEVSHVFDEMGLLVRGLENRFAGGEIYGRVMPAFGSPDNAGAPPPAIVLGLAARLVPALRARTAAAAAALEKDLCATWVRRWHTVERDEMSARADALAQVDLAGLTDRALVAHVDDCLALAREGFRIHFRLVMPMCQALHRLHGFVSDELGWDDSEVAAMLAGHSPATRASEDAMADLRERVEATPGARAALEAGRHAPAEALRTVDPGLAADVEAWAAEHGWAMVNYDAGVPTLAERPAVLTALLLSARARTVAEDGSAVADRVRAALPPERRGDFDDALRAAREVYPLREDNTIVVGDRPSALVRLWMLEAARRLVAAGVVPAAADAAYLHVEEIRAALLDPTADLRDLVLTRRGEEAWVRANPGPLYIGEQGPPPDISRLPAALRRVNEPVLWMIGHEYPPPVEAPADPRVLAAGVAASAGQAEGPARIIRGHQDMHRLQPGDVLVCQVTSPSWAPLFALAAAVVADGGGVLSHAAIAAREHGLPAVLGTGCATETLRDGQLVRVDGARGLVLAAEEVTAPHSERMPAGIR